MFNIMPINQQFSAVIQQKIDLKTKPLGALGQLENCAKQLTLIFSKQLDSEQALVAFKPVISNPSLVVFAGDHGVASQGVSIAPSSVTSQMVANFAAGAPNHLTTLKAKDELRIIADKPKHAASV